MSNTFKSSLANLNTRLTLKLFGIGVLILIMLIPSLFVYNIIFERTNYQHSVIQEIYNGWGNEQTITGPFMVIPYQEGNNAQDSKDPQISYQILLPQQLETSSQLHPKILYRGIYKGVVYKSENQLKGKFDLSALPSRNYLFNKTQLCMGISDVRGIECEPQMIWNGQQLTFEPGTHVSLHYNGVHSSLPLTKESQIIPFTIDLTLKGGGTFQVIPLAKKNTFKVSSEWPDPSFIGGYLPNYRHITDQGFEAEWTIPHHARSYPQTFSVKEFSNSGIPQNILQSAHGVKLLSLNTNYGSVEKSLKYFILIVIATFTVYFLFEVLLKVPFHAFQYMLIGASLLTFYLLLLSLSEYMSFTFSYIASAIAVIMQIIFYTRSRITQKSGLIALAAVLSACYGFLFITLRMVDYALLVGAFGFFIALGIIMYVTRNLRWYEGK